MADSVLKSHLDTDKFFRFSTAGASCNDEPLLVLLKVMEDFCALTSNDDECWEPEASLKQNNANSAICTHKFDAEGWAHKSMNEISKGYYQGAGNSKGAVIQFGSLEADENLRENRSECNHDQGVQNAQQNEITEAAVLVF